MTEERVVDPLIRARQADGGLYAPGWYLSYIPGNADKIATLDGEFTADELRAIANHMEAHP